MDFAVRVAQRPVGGETVIAQRMALIPGGKGANQAYACAALGAPTVMLGCVGADSYGDKLLANLAGAGVETARVQRLQDESTGIALITIDSRGENSITVIQGANARVEADYVDSMRGEIEACDIVLLQLEINLDAVAQVARMAKQAGKTVILDPAPVPQQFPEELLQYVDVIKPNEHELAALTGMPAQGDSLRIAAESLLGRGVANVLVTLGRHGAYVCGADGTRRMCGVEDVPVVDTTAAGDTFTAAVACRLAAGDGLVPAVEYANRVSTVVVQREGAQTSIPRLSELNPDGTLKETAP